VLDIVGSSELQHPQCRTQLNSKLCFPSEMDRSDIWKHSSLLKCPVSTLKFFRDLKSHFHLQVSESCHFPLKNAISKLSSKVICSSIISDNNMNTNCKHKMYQKLPFFF